MSTEQESYDVIIVGGTPGGITAGVAASDRGMDVAILERSNHIGGLPANGLGATDIATRSVTGGLFDEFIHRIYDYYVDTYGEESSQVDACAGGYRFEPSVAEELFEDFVEEHNIDVRYRRQFDASAKNVDRERNDLRSISVIDRDTGEQEVYAGGAFIDATYEGDLASAAGVPFRVGREGRHEFDEPFAGKIYKAVGGPVGDGSTGEGDNAIQAYNYRLCLTTDEDRIPISKPDEYDRDEYASIIKDIEHDNHTDVREEHSPEGIEWILLQTDLPNSKTDMNNHGRAFISTDLPEENWPWPTSSWEWRDRFATRLRRYTLGLLWFVQNDPEVPRTLREEASRWGLAPNEYEDNDHFPRQVYVREGRRIEGEYIYTAHDARPATRGGRPPLHPTSITAAHYPIDSHAVRKREPGRVNLEGFLSDIETEPYTVPYGVIVPRTIDGLLTPVPVSGTHLGFSTLRMEPCWMALGHAAGVAAALSLEHEQPVRDVAVPAIQRELVADDAILVYYEDVDPTHSHYEAAQLLGARGFVPEWSACLDEPVDEETVERWTTKAGLDRRPPYDWRTTTRGEYLSRIADRIDSFETVSESESIT